MKGVFTNLTVVNILKYIHVSDHHTYTLHLHNIICYLYLDKAGEKQKYLIWDPMGAF